MRKVTIEDVSRLTGLSRGTVSRALNDRPDISTRTKQKVVEACQTLNYVPSHAARCLATGRSYTAVVLVNDLYSPFCAGFVRGVIQRAEPARYAVHVLELGNGKEIERLVTLSADRVDGALCAVRLNAGQAGRVREMLPSRYLAMTYPIDRVRCDTLMPDHPEAGRLAARVMFQRGVRDILYVQRPGDGAPERLTGFQQICREQGVDPESILISVGEKGTLRQAVHSRLERVAGVIASDDGLAISVMLLSEHLGRCPGRDIAIIGQGNDPLGSAISPALTTIDPDAEEVGRRAMETLLQRVGEERKDAPLEVRVAPRLIERETTRHLRQS